MQEVLMNKVNPKINHTDYETWVNMDGSLVLNGNIEQMPIYT